MKIKKNIFLTTMATLMCILAVSFSKTESFAIIIESVSMSNTQDVVSSDGSIYLSDLDYIADASYANGSILYDKNTSSKSIALYVNGEKKSFFKGVSAWADSQVVYDISNYTDEYDYISTYIGIDYLQQNSYYNNGATITVFTSIDGETWEQYPIDGLVAMTAFKESVYVQIPVSGVNFIKFCTDKISTDWYRHWYDEVVYADAKLVKSDYVNDPEPFDGIKTVEQYDALIKAKTVKDDEYYLLLLQRDFVNNAEYELLQSLFAYSEKYKDAFMWIFNDLDNLTDFVVGGTPDGSYSNAILVWCLLYENYSDDLERTDLTERGVEYGDLYKRLMMSMSLTHSATVGMWAGGRTDNWDDPNTSHPITRYEIYKDLHQKGKLNDYIFEDLTIEEMRFLTNNIIDDESIEWLNDYSTNYQDRNVSGYAYLTYTTNYTYSLEKYYSEEWYEFWDEKYDLSSYNITYQSPYVKAWTVFEEGGVCGAISKIGSNVAGSFGEPSSVISQPGHAAYIIYTLAGENNDQGFWTIWNNISGWGQSGKTEKLSTRMPNGWGSYGPVGSYPASYVVLAQQALNDFDAYEKSELILLQANVFADDNDKLEEIYRDALAVCDINYDAWYGLAKMYISDDLKTSKELYELAEEIGNTLVYHPRPMWDLMNYIVGYISDATYVVKYDMLMGELLDIAMNATSEDTLQDLCTRQTAIYIAGVIDINVATFSFDGENANTIVMASKYEGSSMRWDYSIDGGLTWTDTDELQHELSTEEIDSMTDENDLLIHIVGQSYVDDNIFAIDLMSANAPTPLYGNDNENIVAGATSAMQWKTDLKDGWKSFDDETPNLEGNTTAYVRYSASGTTLASEVATYDFTENQVTEDRNYVSIKRMSVYDYSTAQDQAGHYASNSIDGDINTIWHSSYTGDDQRYIVLEMVEPIFLSAFEYQPRLSATNGTVKSADLFVSTDGETWQLVESQTGWGNNNTIKSFEISEPMLVKYIKFVGVETYTTTSYSYISALMFNVFEDTTQVAQETQKAEVAYDIIVPTAKDVTATLVNKTDGLMVTNNGGSDTYVFTENGSFTFEFENAQGVKGSVTAVVDNINKSAPTADIEYSETTWTELSVVATLVNTSTEITITNNNGESMYVFEENGSFTFEFEDQFGNQGSQTATVTWIGTPPVTGGSSSGGTTTYPTIPQEDEFEIPQENKVEFDDLDGHWAKNDIEILASLGVINGMTQDEFWPSYNVTRGMIVTILGRLENADVSYENSFADVRQDKYYADYVQWAYESGVVKGYTDGTFMPESFITRQEISVMLSNYIEYKSKEIDTNSNNTQLNDQDEVSYWAEESMELMLELGLFSGDNNNMLNPKNTATRAELVTIINRYLAL